MRWLRDHAASFAIVVSVLTVVLVFTGWGTAMASNIQSVFISNSPSQPVPTHEQGTANVHVVPSGTYQIHDSAEAPVGEDTVEDVLSTNVASGGAQVDAVSMSATLPSGQAILVCSVENFTTKQHGYIPLVRQGTANGLDYYDGNAVVEMHFGFADEIDVSCQRDAGDRGPFDLDFNLFGEAAPS